MAEAIYYVCILRQNPTKSLLKTLKAELKGHEG